MGANDLPASVDIGLRKVVCSREEIIMEAGEKLTHPIHQASVAAVLRNPWIGTGPAEDLTVDAAAIAPPLSKLLTDRLTDVLGGAENIEAFGKAAVVGLRGEIEHAGALIHTPFFGNLVREFLEGTSVLCFADTRSDAGQSLVVPMWHKVEATRRDHYQTTSVRIADGPFPDEIVVVAAASTGPRPHPRLGDRSTDPKVTSLLLEGA